MYEAIDDPYCYQGTTVLRNKLGIREAEQLTAFEEEISKARAGEPLPSGRLTPTHYRAIHRHLFQDVYGWAGQLRRVRIAKGGSMFAYPEHLAANLQGLFQELRRRHGLRGLPGLRSPSRRRTCWPN
ncbi:Fic/DOC family protein [Methylobacterium oryzae CBMB20]